MLFFLVIVLGPAAGGVFMGRQMAERQSTARADGRLEGASIAVVHALNQQVAQAMQRLTASVALRAVAGGASVDALHRVRMGAGLDYLVVVRRGHVVAADLRPATFRPGVSVSAATLAGGRHREDALQRAAEMLFERLAVSWTIAGLELTRQRELLGRYRMASAAERNFVRDALREHVAEHFPELEAP